ncbi:MAG: Clp1/GlmU family protein [bacterium]|nr:Clp1/GlmU family protein [bacterium]
MMKEMHFLKDEIYLFKGPVRFRVKDGVAEAVGSILRKETESQFIPLGKSIPVEIREPGCIEILEGEMTSIEKLDHRTIPSEWDHLVEKIVAGSLKKIIIVGEMDTGKSFLATYIANQLVNRGKKVGVIDSDLGQSDIGPPGTIGLTILDKPIMFLQDARIDGLEFVGAHSAGLHMVNTLMSFKRIMERSIHLTDITVLNTSGWVMGDGGRLFVGATIDLFEPDVIVLMQRQGECEHLVKRIFPKSRIVSMTVSKKASETSKGDREKLRNLSSQKYFKNAKAITLDLDEVMTDNCFFHSGQVLSAIPLKTRKKILFAEKYPSFEGILVVSDKLLTPRELNELRTLGHRTIRNLRLDFADEALVGLRRGDYLLLDVGIIRNIDFINRKITVVTPYAGPVQDISVMQFGALKYKSDGTEDGFIEPGSF